MFARIKAWLLSKNITTHAVGAVIVGFAIAYNSSPELRNYIGTLFAGYPVVVTKLGMLCADIAAGVALWRNFAHSSSPAGKVAAAESIMASADRPTEAAVAAATQPAKEQGVTIAPMILLALLLIPSAIAGCKRQAPPVWAASAPALEIPGEMIAGANYAVVGYEKDAAAGLEYTKDATLKAIVSDIQKVLTYAQPAFGQWEAATRQNPGAPEPAALANAITTIESDIARLPAQLKRK